MIGKPTGWKVSLHARLELPVADTLQGFVIQDDGTIIASQGLPSGAIEDTYLSKLSPTGELLDVMLAVDGGHGTILGSLGPDEITFDHMGRLFAVKWRPGKITTTSPDVRRWGGTFQSGPVSAVIDRVHRLALFYDSERKTTVLRSLIDVEAQRDRALGRTGALTNRDRAGRMTLRQGWGLWDRQLIYLIGQHDRSQELISYNLGSGQLQWRLPADLCGDDVAWQEPEGVFVSSRGVLAGNPLIFVGYTNRIYSGTAFRRDHVIMRLRDPNAKLDSDVGWMHVDPAKVTTTLLGLNADGTQKTKRPPRYNLWVERTEPRFDRANAVTTHETFYALDLLVPGRAPDLT